MTREQPYFGGAGLASTTGSYATAGPAVRFVFSAIFNFPNLFIPYHRLVDVFVLVKKLRGLSLWLMSTAMQLLAHQT